MAKTVRRKNSKTKRNNLRKSKRRTYKRRRTYKKTKRNLRGGSYLLPYNEVTQRELLLDVDVGGILEILTNALPKVITTKLSGIPITLPGEPIFTVHHEKKILILVETVPIKLVMNMVGGVNTSQDLIPFTVNDMNSWLEPVIHGDIIAFMRSQGGGGRLKTALGRALGIGKKAARVPREAMGRLGRGITKTFKSLIQWILKTIRGRIRTGAFNLSLYVTERGGNYSLYLKAVNGGTTRSALLFGSVLGDKNGTVDMQSVLNDIDIEAPEDAPEAPEDAPEAPEDAPKARPMEIIGPIQGDEPYDNDQQAALKAAQRASVLRERQAAIYSNCYERKGCDKIRGLGSDMRQNRCVNTCDKEARELT
jgi:hypothetical protein